jgi:hypothetical protein
MKTFITALLFATTLAFASDVTVCGKFLDNGDSFQIIDSKLNPYIDMGLRGPRDPNGVIKMVFADQPWGKNYCLTGTVQAFERQNQIAFEFVSLTHGKRD